MIQQKINFELSIKANSSPSFCLTVPENLMASGGLLHTKKTESFSVILQIFKSCEIPFSEKNLDIGPFPIILSLFFSNVI